MKHSEFHIGLEFIGTAGFRWRCTDVGTRTKGVLRFDRRATDGEILHPYTARKSDKHWIVKLYLPFTRAFGEMPEYDFIALPIATADDVLARSKRHATE